MPNIFHHSSAWVAKHKRHHHLALAGLALVVAISGAYTYRHEIAQAATYTFTQTSWAGGVTANTANHTSNQSNWTQYSATSTSVIVGGGGVSLSATSKTAVDDGAALSTRTDYTAGTAPVTIAVSPDGTSAYVANFVGNTVSMFARNTTTGTLSAKTDYTTGLAPYGVAVSSDGTSVYVTNNTSNTVSMFTRNITTGALSSKTDYTTGSGPYGVAISPDGVSVYVVNYTGTSVSMFTRDVTTGTLSTKTDYTTGTNPLSVVISPDGTSVYVLNNGGGSGNTVSMFTRDVTTGTLSTKTDYTTGTNPYKLAISTDGVSVYVVNRNSNTVSMFARNTTTGTLSAKIDYATNGQPQGVTISPDGASVYVANYGSNNASMFTRNTTTGALSAKTDYVTGVQPYDITTSPDGTSVYVGNYGAGTGNTISMYSRVVSGGASGFESGTYSSTVMTGAGSGASVGLKTYGALSALNPFTATTGTGPSSVIFSPDGTSVYVTNWTSNTVSMFARNTTTGTLSAKTDYATGTNPHGISMSSDGTSVYVGNYTSNTVSMFARNITTGTLSAKTDYTTGVQPYVPVISPDGTFVYMSNGGSNTVSMYSRNTSTGALSPLATSTVATMGAPFDMSISLDGSNVYVANYSSATVSMFARNATTGELSARVDYITGTNPRSVTISQDGTSVYVTNWTSNTVSMFARNTTTGTLSAKTDYAAGAQPIDVDVSHDGTSVYLVNYNDHTVSMYNRNTTTGALTALVPPTATIVGGWFPFGVANSPEGSSVYVANRNSDTISMFARNTATSGTFTSSVINTLGKSEFTTLSYTATLNGQTLTMDARAGNTATPDGAWTAWQTGIASGGSISALSGNQYIQYRANLSTTVVGVTPTLDSVTVNYSQYAPSGDLTSSKFDSESGVGYVSNIRWSASSVSATEVVKLQVRSSPDGTTWTNWCGASTACLGTDYFTLDTGEAGGLNAGHPLRIGNDDRYIQYKAFLTSNGSVTPTLVSTAVEYVVNGAPVVSNVSAVQGGNGLVTVLYDVADADNTIGNTVNITLQYCTTNCTTGLEVWVDAVTVTGSAGAGVPLGTGKSITWNPTIDYPSQFKPNAQKVRIKANDTAVTSNLGYGTSGTFTLSTIQPSVVAYLNSSGAQDIVNLTATSIFTLEYRLCDTADFVACPTWTPITSGVATPIGWVALGAPNAETVYVEVRDLYGNTTSATITAPATPTSLLSADVSNPTANSFGETLSWTVVPNAVSYRVYSATSTDSVTAPGSYALLASPTTNVFSHTITNATTSAYWYRVGAVSANGDISNFTTAQTAGDVPDSFGTSLADTTPPTIASITAPTGSLKNNSAQVTFTTNELAIAQVLYGTSFLADCSYGTTKSTSAYVTAQAVTIDNLQPSTTYYYCVKATDVLGNVSVATTGGTFATIGGPTISNVTVQNLAGTSATITWNTATSSDSYVYYGTSNTLATSITVGSATLVPCTGSVCQHQVGLSGLTSGTIYYFKVKSTDSDANSVTDTNSGSYFSFTTLTDTVPPAITGIDTPVKSSNAAVIVWQTDEPATSQVLWGLASSTLDRLTINDTTQSIYHVMTLSSATTNTGSGGGTNELAPETTYYYAVKSADASNNFTISSVQSFATPPTGNVVVSVVNLVTQGSNTTDVIPPSISNVTVSDITPFSAVVGFETSEDTFVSVQHGASISYGSGADDGIVSKTHTVKLRGLTLGTEYHFKVTAMDRAGNLGHSADQTFKTTFLSENLEAMANVENIEQFQKEIEAAIESILPSLVPPFVTKPAITDITESSATISFKTNIKAFPVVVYAESALYDETKENPYAGEVSDTTEKAVSHELKLTGLKGNTKYHVQARGFSLPKVLGKSVDLTFITKASKIAGSIVERKKDSFTVVWTTGEPTSSIVEFKNIKTGVTERKTEDAKRTSHSMKIENLPSGTAYEVFLSGMTEQGNIAEASSPLSVTTSTDTTAPAISGFKVDNALVPGRTDRIQTIVSWVTDEPSNSTVYYEEGAGTAGDESELANKNEVLDSYVTNHSVIIPNLRSGTIYSLKVTSSDDSGNLGSFGPRTVITPRQTESIMDIIFKNFEDSFKFLRKI